MKRRAIPVLLVDDSPADVLLTREALSEGRLLLDLHVVEDGVDALDFLRGRGKFSHAPRPALVLLDFNLPRKDGREVLAEMKADAALREIPVVVLTTSQSDDDMHRAYGLCANCYIVKPVDFASFVAVVRGIQHFWFSIVSLPQK